MTEVTWEDLLERAESIYEAVAVMYHRARQVTNDQKQQIQSEMEVASASENKDSEDFDDVEIDREALMKDHKKYPKPSRVAMEEMAQGKIQFEYRNEDEEESSES